MYLFLLFYSSFSRITYAEDQKIADAGTFTLLKEDHTLGNIIRMSLLADGRVLFAGYRMPHPLENRMLIKIKTRPGYKPVSVLLEHLHLLKVEVGLLQTQFEEQSVDAKTQKHGRADIERERRRDQIGPMIFVFLLLISPRFCFCVNVQGPIETKSGTR